ncbi:hypothetical protein BDR07DRAFT_1612170 [Suillus spraguei]|nr:hypothetical protein BDR07DRAFT_1612170 [Suillus spraguei]
MSVSNIFESSAVDMNSDEKKSEGHVTKKIKITASNGWEHVLARGGIKSRFTKTSTTDAPEFLKNHRSRAKKKSLEILISLPLDILFEIFGRLLPLDLLHLARTTKDLRAILMHRSSTTVWMAARSNVKGMPACADDMSEPAHASLAFGTHCHNCLKSNVRSADWNLRVRYCQKCFKERTEVIDDKFKTTFGLKLHRCTPLSMTQNINDNRCLISDRESLVDELSKLGPEGRSVLRGMKRDEVLIRKEHAILCTKWIESEQQSRWKGLDHLRSLRYDAIVEKLIELGWEEDVNKLPDRHTARIHKLIHFEDHPLVKQPKPLTDRSKGFRLPLIYMGQMREFRIQQERKQQIRERQSIAATIYSDWLRETGYHEFLMPTAADLFGKWQVRNIVELPAHQTVTAKDFQPVHKELLEIVDAWKRSIGYNLRSDLLWQFEDYLSDWRERLYDQCEKLAVAVFTCTAWLCEDIPEQGYPGNTVQREWSTENLKFDTTASRTVKNILDACDLDWRECSYGNHCDGERPMIVRSWRESVKHCAKKHWSDSTVKWQKISDEEARSLRQDQQEAAASTTTPPRKIWRCAHCHNKPREPEKMTVQGMTDHLEDHHSISPIDQVAGKDFFEALDVPPTAIPFVKLKPKAVDPCL